MSLPLTPSPTVQSGAVLCEEALPCSEDLSCGSIGIALGATSTGSVSITQISVGSLTLTSVSTGSVSLTQTSSGSLNLTPVSPV